jgi:predicted NACHT family NTPase
MRQHYRGVDLEILRPLSEQGETAQMHLRQVFVPQLVREDPPPTELPRELWRRLADTGHLTDDDLPDSADREELEAARRAYQDRPARPVLDVLGEPGSRKVVLLGDPGAGKSTLARYLVVVLADQEPLGRVHSGADLGGDPAAGVRPDEEPDLGTAGESGAAPVAVTPARARGMASFAGWLPLLVELRTYSGERRRSETFLDLLHHEHETSGLGMPKPLLEEFLRTDGRAVVVFDGLDEVFDPQARREVVAQIEGFAARYPRTRVIVTSRVIGYRPAALANAGFTHWTLQDLNVDQVEVFAVTWYAQSCPDDPGLATRLKNTLLAAVKDSSAVAELAGNPMLLTILAIIGRRRELPRDRATVYEHAVTVLIENWDKSRDLYGGRGEPDASLLEGKDRRELLHLVARSMQNAPGGLAGNHIHADLLEGLLQEHLRGRFQLTADRAITCARSVLTQFRERNFILALFGAQVYGFVHRAFLEYLAAEDIRHRLADHDLDEEDLLSIFHRHRHDPTWTEVLLLLSGMIPPRFATRVVTELLASDPHWRARSGCLPRNLLLALRCVVEIRRGAALDPLGDRIAQALCGAF